MSRTISISPLTRIEGHLAVHTETEPIDGNRHRIVSAHCEGEMFRGIENILVGRDPLDAQQITQRICGVCPISHGIASVRAQEMAYGITPNHNGRLLQNLILAANFLQSHLLHFYHLAALDFVDVTAVLRYTGRNRTLISVKNWVADAVANNDVFPAAPFLPRYEADYIDDDTTNQLLLLHYAEALEIRKVAHEMAAVFAAKMPHSTSIVPGGCTQVPTLERLLAFKTRLKKVAEFIEHTYLPDLVIAAGAFPHLWDEGAGYGDMLSFGVFEMDGDSNPLFPAGALINGQFAALNPDHISEEVGHSRFTSSSGLHPAVGETSAAPHKDGAYSWLKAPRYQGRPMEVGPLARVMAGYHAPQSSWIRTEVDAVLASVNQSPEKMYSILGRHLSRGLEALWIARAAHSWLEDLKLDQSPARDFKIPQTGSGFGLIEAPRGALGHWTTLSNHRIERYQCVVPTTWNCSPRDDAGRPGPVEKALEGVVIENPDHPIEPARMVRSFDPCLACAVH